MKVFVWQYVDGVSQSYHDGGGTVVFAKDLQRARELLQEAGGVQKNCGAFKEEPDYEASVYGQEEKVFIFPDAGCC